MQVFSDTVKRSLERNDVPAFNYRSRAIFAIKKLPSTGHEVFTFGMYVREFGPSTPVPNRFV